MSDIIEMAEYRTTARFITTVPAENIERPRYRVGATRTYRVL